ncbi:MAG: hypothetical protein JW704_13410 [Anaerolineaceae bacterium]|nr:hypothetical protein [Anaerolineaceae bacterium]MBN2676685.1 hypothetical protein [Anaerolineaceae bacterium]
MSFFDKLKPVPLPEALNPSSRKEAERLIEELIGVGKRDDYLSELPGGSFNFQCHNIEARKIGQKLNELGGLELMMTARLRVRKKLGEVLMSHLDYAWSDIGDWKP